MNRGMGLEGRKVRTEPGAAAYHIIYLVSLPLVEFGKVVS